MVLPDGNSITTTDGGRTWITTASFSRNGLYTDQLGRQFVTTDGGNSWKAKVQEKKSAIDQGSAAVLGSTLYLSFEEPQTGTLTVCDIVGRVIHSELILAQTSHRHYLDKTGVFFVVLRTHEREFSFSVINTR
jgi:hypothetical protein